MSLVPPLLEIGSKSPADVVTGDRRRPRPTARGGQGTRKLADENLADISRAIQP